ncbi:hypothetical protein ACKKBF_B17215 [Auxenochlorella protothecoides x Auxenochlorella symbiontica]
MATAVAVALFLAEEIPVTVPRGRPLPINRGLPLPINRGLPLPIDRGLPIFPSGVTPTLPSGVTPTLPMESPPPSPVESPPPSPVESPPPSPVESPPPSPVESPPPSPVESPPPPTSQSPPPPTTASGASQYIIPGSATYTGDGTAYSAAIASDGGIAFACSYRYLNSYFTQYFAAMNSAQWNSGAACGQCVVARCVDPACVTQNFNVLVQIVDKCPECAEGALDFSYPAYQAITGVPPNRLTVSWEYADCSSFISGGIQYNPKEGSNGFWQAFYLDNYSYTLASVSWGGVTLTRSQFQFFQRSGPMPTGPFQLTITSTTGQTVTATVNDFNTPQDLGVNFS